jgi:hypothetical protein
MLVTVRAGLAAQTKRGTACAIPSILAVTDESRVALQPLAALRCLLSSQHPGTPDPTPAPPRSVLTMVGGKVVYKAADTK